MRAFAIPCLDCKTLTKYSNRCESCSKIKEQKRNAERLHYKGQYAKLAKQVRENAIECWICHKGYDPEDPWQADHYLPGNPNSILLPAHRSCNIKRNTSP
jgi:hypothetical protein